MKKPFLLGSVILLCLGVLNLAAIYKKEDPITDTQTNPIGYKEKMGELKEGPKEAPTPSFKFYGKEKFLTESNLSEEKEEVDEIQSSDRIPLPTEPIPEDLSGEDAPQDQEPAAEDAAGPGGEDWWSEDSGSVPADQNSVKKI